MAKSPAFAIDRQAIVAAVSTPVYARRSQCVTIVNGCATDLLIYSDEGNPNAYIAIAAGWERTFEAVFFPAGEPVLWMICTQSGTVTLIWR